MPHQCVRCNTFYNDGSIEILRGCKCGSKLFFFVKEEYLEKAKKATAKMTPEQKIQIEEDVYELIGAEKENEPVVLDFESVRITEPGKFELDLVQLFNKEYPVVFKLEEGKYMIDIPETFQRRHELKGKEKKRK